MSRLCLLSIALCCIVSAASADVTISQNYDNVVVTTGDSVELICSSNLPYKYCTFVQPDGTLRNLDKGASYENGRLQYHGNGETECGISISSVSDADNGEWKCTITDSTFTSGDGSVAVTVAVAPKKLLLRVDGAEATGETVSATLNDAGTVEMDVDCVAEQARPKPEFKWFVGSTEIQGVVEAREENAEDGEGKADYVSTLKYYADAKHNGQPLRCEVTHQAYSEADKESNKNKIEKLLELFFKPMQKPKPVEFYNLHEGQSNDITIKFEANPEPETGFWHIEGVEQPIAIGTESLDQRFKSSAVQPAEIDGEYSVTLTIATLTKEMAGKTNKLSMTNAQGTTEYAFTLELGDKPVADGEGGSTVTKSGKAEPMNSGPVIVIIIIVVVILAIVGLAVVARSKGMLCFSAKNGEQLTEDKNAADFDNAEKGNVEPLNPKGDSAAKDTPDKQPAASEPAKASTENEEKKSNGAHTPV